MGVKVLLVDDNAKVRKSMIGFMHTYEDVAVVGEAENGQAAIELCNELHPDVVLMDVSMPGMDGVATTQAIREQHPEIKILMLSGIEETALLDAARAAGAVGSISKHDSPDDLIAAIYRVARGSDHNINVNSG